MTNYTAISPTTFLPLAQDEDWLTKFLKGFLTPPEEDLSDISAYEESPMEASFYGRDCKNYGSLRQLSCVSGFGPSPLATQTMGKCARAVRGAMEGWGLNTAGHPDTAAKYHTTGFMAKMGFHQIGSGQGEHVSADYQPKDKDVAVFVKKGEPNNAGHIVRYDAETGRWLSDFDPVSKGFQHKFSGLANPDQYDTFVYRHDGLAPAATQTQTVKADSPAKLNPTFVA